MATFPTMGAYRNLKMLCDMNDKVFGEMQFHVGWCKTETIPLWGNRYSFMVRVSALRNELPNERQQMAYRTFKEQLETIGRETLGPVRDFLAAHTDEAVEVLGQPLPLNLTDLLRPDQVLFFQSGHTALLFDVAWTDEEVAILLGPSVRVDYGDILDGEI